MLVRQDKKLKAVRIGPIGDKFLFPLLLALLLGAFFWPAFVWMNRRFFEEGSYYGYGWLIPAAVAFLIWQRREKLSRIPPRPSWWGLPLILGGVFLHLGAQLIQVNFLSVCALILILIGLSFFHWGSARTRLILAPLILLVFMIPLPGIWVITVAFYLKNFSADVGVELARLLGLPVIRNGVEIGLPTAPPGETLRIGDPCSGLRSLLSFGALGGFFSILLPLPALKKLFVFLTAVILAPISNIIRVWSLIILRQTIGPRVLSGHWHIVLGMIIFFLCFLLFLQVIRWLLN